jgi:hypothetical protein
VSEVLKFQKTKNEIRSYIDSADQEVFISLPNDFNGLENLCFSPSSLEFSINFYENFSSNRVSRDYLESLDLGFLLNFPNSSKTTLVYIDDDFDLDLFFFKNIRVSKDKYLSMDKSFIRLHETGDIEYRLPELDIALLPYLNAILSRATDFEYDFLTGDREILSFLKRKGLDYITSNYGYDLLDNF